MANIFISYSKQDPETTKALAADLEARGHTTWWDTSLLAGERFPEKIRQEIEAAKAVIVIWSEGALASQWVYAEAQEADRLGKLIPVYVPGVDLGKIPLPFGSRHMEPVTNREKLYAALAALSSTTSIPASHAVWEDEAAALFQRGDDYYYGRGVPNDDAEALRLFRRAADMGHAQAILRVGQMNELGRGVAPNYAEAVRLYRRAADMGEAQAMGALGLCYYAGKGVEQDYVQAAALFCRAAELGNAVSFFGLALMHMYGQGVREDYAEAARLLRKGAEKGDHLSAFRLAELYEKGWGVDKSRKKARRWYERAAELGHPDAAAAAKRLKSWF